MHEHIYYDLGHDDIRCAWCGFITQKMGMEGHVTREEAEAHAVRLLKPERLAIKADLLEDLEIYQAPVT